MFRLGVVILSAVAFVFSSAIALAGPKIVMDFYYCGGSFNCWNSTQFPVDADCTFQNGTCTMTSRINHKKCLGPGLPTQSCTQYDNVPCKQIDYYSGGTCPDCNVAGVNTSTVTIKENGCY
jgi:hypothetical protein